MNNNYYLGIVVAVDNHELLKKSKEHNDSRIRHIYTRYIIPWLHKS